MEGPSGVVALVLAETAAGAAVFLWATGLWGKVRRGFFTLTTAVALGCSLLATLAASAAALPREVGTVRVAVLLSAGTAVLLGLSLSLLILRLDRGARVAGIPGAVLAVVTLVGLSGVAGPALGTALLQLLAGAAFMGAVTNGLLLGHWYLVDRRLPRDHIHRYAVLLLGAVVLEAAAVGLLGFGGSAAVGFSPLLRIAGLATWLGLGMIACTALIAVLIRATLKGTGPRAVQAATGFFYLAVITAFTAEMAAKVGFLG